MVCALNNMWNLALKVEILLYEQSYSSNKLYKFVETSKRGARMVKAFS